MDHIEFELWLGLFSTYGSPGGDVTMRTAM